MVWVENKLILDVLYFWIKNLSSINMNNWDYCTKIVVHLISFVSACHLFCSLLHTHLFFSSFFNSLSGRETQTMKAVSQVCSHWKLVQKYLQIIGSSHSRNGNLVWTGQWPLPINNLVEGIQWPHLPKVSVLRLVAFSANFSACLSYLTFLIKSIFYEFREYHATIVVWVHIKT